MSNQIEHNIDFDGKVIFLMPEQKNGFVIRRYRSKQRAANRVTSEYSKKLKYTEANIKIISKKKLTRTLTFVYT